MNWTTVLVIAVIVFLVPTALFAAFATTKDSHQYERHYSEFGYSQEIQADRDHSSVEQAPYANEPPVVNWPQDF